MKSLDDLISAVESLGIPWANGAFQDGEEPPPPFIVLVAGFSQSAYADNIAWARAMPYDVALYTRARDYELERRIGDAIEAAGIAYELAITHIDAEHLTEAAFSVAVSED